jgi:hypothetical protein
MEGWNAEAAHNLKLKNYIYFGMAFSFLVEILNLLLGWMVEMVRACSFKKAAK